MDKYGMITPEEALVLSNKFCESIRQIFEDRPDDEEEERTCKNCKWWHADHFCFNKVVDDAMDRVGTSFWSREDFGCNQWEAKEECERPEPIEHPYIIQESE